MKYERDLSDNVNEKEYVFKFTVSETEIKTAKFDSFDQKLIDIAKESEKISSKIMALHILARAIEWYEDHKDVIQALTEKEGKNAEGKKASLSNAWK